MAYVTPDPGGFTDAGDPRARAYAMFRLNQALRGGYTPLIDVHAAQADPAAWWRQFSSVYGGAPPVNSLSGGNPLNGAALAAAAQQTAPHRFAPAVQHTTPRQAVMQRLTHGYRSGFGGWQTV